MKYPRNCQHSEVGPCARCDVDFRARLGAQKACLVKGLRILAAVQPRMTLDDWLDLDQSMSVITGGPPYVPELGEHERLSREELPHESRVES